MIEWTNLYLVALVSIFATIALVALFSIAIRLFTNARHLEAAARKGKPRAIRGRWLNLYAAAVLFAFCAAALLFGIYLVVPYFH